MIDQLPSCREATEDALAEAEKARAHGDLARLAEQLGVTAKEGLGMDRAMREVGLFSDRELRVLGKARFAMRQGHEEPADAETMLAVAKMYLTDLFDQEADTFG